MSTTDQVTAVWKVEPALVARSLIVGAVVTEVVLLVLNYVFNFYDVAGDISIRRIFNIAREESIPTFFASLQAVAVGLTALALRATTRVPSERRAWTLVAVFWIYVGVDDNAEIHERVGSALGRTTGDSGLLESWPGFAWQIFVAPVLALGLLAVVAIAWRSSSTGRALLVACLAGFAVAQGIDVIEGSEGIFDGWADDLGVAPYTVAHGFRSVEEMLEMLGTTAYWSVVLGILARRLPGRQVQFAADAA